MSMNLVIGATGIVGSHVVLELLQNEENVLATKQKQSDINKVKDLFAYYGPKVEELFSKIKWIDVDVRDVFSIEEALEGVTTVYHCAGLVSFKGSDKKNLNEINEIGTKNVVDACLYKKTTALCYVSSIATINNLDYTLPLNEQVFWKKSGNESDYAISKYNAEREVWRGMEEGLNAVIVNPGVILSSGFWSQSSSRIFEQCYKGNKYYTSGSTAFIAASDVAKIMYALLNKKLYGDRYILIENNYSFKDILTTIQINLDKPAPSINVKPGILKLVQILERIFTFFIGKERKLTRALVNSLNNTQIYSNQKVMSAIAYEFLPIHTTIEEICRNYRLQKEVMHSSL